MDTLLSIHCLRAEKVVRKRPYVRGVKNVCKAFANRFPPPPLPESFEQLQLAPEITPKDPPSSSAGCSGNVTPALCCEYVVRKRPYVRGVKNVCKAFANRFPPPPLPESFRRTRNRFVLRVRRKLSGSGGGGKRFAKALQTFLTPRTYGP
jgi:hypothetical protein